MPAIQSETRRCTDRRRRTERLSPRRPSGGDPGRRRRADTEHVYRRVRAARAADLCHARLAPGATLLVQRPGRPLAAPLCGGHPRRPVRRGSEIAAGLHHRLQGDRRRPGRLLRLRGHASGCPAARRGCTTVVYRRPRHGLLRAAYRQGCPGAPLRSPPRRYAACWPLLGKLLVDFGLRRAHGAEAGLLAARAGYLAGMSGTSTVLAGAAFGIPVFGTMAHSFIEAHDSEVDAFEHFARSLPSSVVLLIDTYDTEIAAGKVVQLAQRRRNCVCYLSTPCNRPGRTGKESGRHGHGSGAAIAG